MKTIIPIIFLFFLIGCSSIKNQNLPSTKNNKIFVENIIKNYNNLNNFLNNKKLCDTFLLMFSFDEWMEDLKSHIINNKFYDGFKFEIIDSIGIHQISKDNNIFYINKIKIRSNYNKDIIWFSFKLYYSEKIWKLNSYCFCNNPSQQAWGEDVPCDKK